MPSTRSQTGGLKQPRSLKHLDDNEQQSPENKAESSISAAPGLPNITKHIRKPACRTSHPKRLLKMHNCLNIQASLKNARALKATNISGTVNGAAAVSLNKAKAPKKPTETKNNDPKSLYIQDKQDEVEDFPRTKGPIERQFMMEKEKEMKRLNLQKFSEFTPPECECQVDSIPRPFGPFYTHLGSAPTLAQLRRDFEAKTGFRGRQIRFERVQYCPIEGKTEHGCPIAKWVISRRDEIEQLLVVTKSRPGHTCPTAIFVVSIIAWAGLPQGDADRSYAFLKTKVGTFGTDLQRRCTLNAEKTCACQGVDNSTQGGSFTFGCSRAKYQSLCKFNRCPLDKQDAIRKFRLTKETEEESLEAHLNSLANTINPLFSKLVPKAHHNMAVSDSMVNYCRIGRPSSSLASGQCPVEERRPFASVSAVMDFCAHAHRDTNNMEGGVTAVVSLTRPENRDKFGIAAGQVADEQLHVLPHYRPNLDKDEFGSREGMRQLLKEGAVTALTQFKRRLTRRPSTANNKNNMSRRLILNKFTDCKESFKDSNVGGVAFRLPHGSVLFEYAKTELHATTALKKPNRKQPTRIGVVFYQHAGLEFPNHGYPVSEERAYTKYSREYEAWKRGTFLFTRRQVAQLAAQGFKLPSHNIQTVNRPGEFKGIKIKKPNLDFLKGDPSGGIPPAPTAENVTLYKPPENWTCLSHEQNSKRNSTEVSIPKANANTPPVAMKEKYFTDPQPSPSGVREPNMKEVIRVQSGNSVALSTSFFMLQTKDVPWADFKAVLGAASKGL